VLDCEAGLVRAVRASYLLAAACTQLREMVSLITNRSIPIKVRGSVCESCVRSVMLYGAETWALTWKLEDRMLRYMVVVRWQDMISSEDVAKRCGFKMFAR